MQKGLLTENTNTINVVGSDTIVSPKSEGHDVSKKIDTCVGDWRSANK